MLRPHRWMPPVAAALFFAACSSTAPVARETAPPSPPQAAVSPSEGDLANLEARFWAQQVEARSAFSEADVAFMTGMIGHHAQALIMSRLAPENGASPAVQRLAARIINAQQDEIKAMQGWLRDRSQPVPEVHIDGLTLMIHLAEPEPAADNEHAGMDHGAAKGEDHAGMGHGTKPDEHAGMSHEGMDHAAMGHGAPQEASKDGAMRHGGGHDHAGMPGMLTDAQLRELADARGPAFDALFLRYMIQHHSGAVIMVDDLFNAGGATQDEASFKLASDINVDQRTEIARMQRMLDALTAPRQN